MPRRSLNRLALESALSTHGISQAKLANHLSVSREAVSKWLSGRAMPRPDKLLDIALLLDLDVRDISKIEFDDREPVVAFRKKGAAKITEDFIAHAQHMGRLLARLTAYLPFDCLVTPVHLKDPSCDFRYLEAAAQKVRNKLKVGDTDAIEFVSLVGMFGDLQAVIVPALWGTKNNHRNAVHIYLPESTTTWVYLNLDTYVFDFLFWMAHELGHVLSPNLRGEEAEDFADAFAGALLFPAELCAELNSELRRKRTDQTRLSLIARWAEEFGISPVTVVRRLNAYRDESDEPVVEFGPTLYAVATKLNRKWPTVCESIFQTGRPKPGEYIRECEGLFKTPFFDALRQYVSEGEVGASYIQAILDIPLRDAKAIQAELC